MKDFLKKHQDIFLAILAVVFVVTLAGCGIWTVKTLVSDLGRSLDPSTNTGDVVNFNINEAKAVLGN